MIKSVVKISILSVLVGLCSLRVSISEESFVAATNYGQLPLYFVPNEGQVDEEALFYAKTSHYTLWMTKDGLIFDRLHREEKEIGKNLVPHHSLRCEPQDYSYSRDISRMHFCDAEPDTELIPIEITGHRVNYFTGKDRSDWRTGLRASKGVLYRGLYSNVDLKIYGVEKQIEYDFVVRPGGDVSDIRFAYRDAQKTEIDKNGNLRVKIKSVDISKSSKTDSSQESTAISEFTHQKPNCYQVIDGKKIKIDASFRKIADNTYTFEVAPYNKAYDLVIDPLVMTYSTYLGGSANDRGDGIAVDHSGAAYITGSTQSTDFPSQSPYQAANAGAYDVFVTKIDPTGTALIYSTYLGGSEDDGGRSITVDSTGAAYITGKTESSNFPTHNPIYGTYNGGSYGDAFIAKLSPTGADLVYSTYLGGTDSDYAADIAIDSEGAAYITGTTASSDFPTLNAFQATHAGRYDVFVIKIDPSGMVLVYSTFLGGEYWEDGMGIAVDSQNEACVTGYTNSDDFPTLNPIVDYKYDDIFITKLDSSGSALIFSSCLGDWDSDGGTAIAIDEDDAIYVTGYTTTADLPWGHPTDAFVVKLPPSGGSIDYLYQWGSGSWYKVSGQGIAVDGEGAAYVVASDYPLDPYPGESADTFIAKINSNGDARVYKKYLVGSDEEWGYHIALDSERDVYVTGRTDSLDFSTQDPIQGSLAGGDDAFVSKLPGDLKLDIKANGSDGPIMINTGDILVVTVELRPGPLIGYDADWGLAAKTPLGWYHYDKDLGWLPGGVIPLQRTLVDIPEREVLDMPGLPVGNYTFYFGVDTNMDGAITWEMIYLDMVKVQVN
jgi:hypothetical protein